MQTRRTINLVLEEARRTLQRVTAEQAHAALRSGATLVDVRTWEHRERDGRIDGALEIALNVLEWRLDPDSDARVVDAPSLADLVIVLCEQGYSSSLAAARLQDLGFSRATDVVGGFEAWRAAGLPVAYA